MGKALATFQKSIDDVPPDLQSQYLTELVGFILRYLDDEGPVDIEVFRKACQHAAKELEPQ